MKIKFKELYSLVEAQNLYDSQEERLFELTLLLVRNTKIAKAEIETFEEARDKVTKSEEFVKYQQERQEIVNAYRLKDKEGKFVPSMQNGQQGFQLDPERIVELQEELKTFDKPHEKMLDKVRKDREEATQKLEEEVEVPLKKITVAKHIGILDTKVLVALAPIIEVTLTKKLLGKKIDEIQASELDRLLDFCEFA